MAPRNAPSARWTVLLLAVALLASGVVAYTLIQVTGSSAPATVASVASAGPGSPASAPSSEPGSSTSSAAPKSAGTSSSRTSGTTTSQELVLPGSGVSLPAAWRGTAVVTITVRGDCAQGAGSSTYTVPADLAMDVPKADSTGPDDNPLSLSLGVNSTGVPGLSVFSAALDDDGELHRFWRLTARPGPDGRTEIEGNMVEDRSSEPGPSLNLLSDNETDLQPCEAGRAVGVPRSLAPGSLVSGWISDGAALLTLTASTVDDERTVTATVMAERRT